MRKSVNGEFANYYYVFDRVRPLSFVQFCRWDARKRNVALCRCTGDRGQLRAARASAECGDVPVVFRLHVQMSHERQPGGQVERYRGRFFVRHPSEFAEEMKRFVAGELFDETVELRTVSSHLVDL